MSKTKPRSLPQPGADSAPRRGSSEVGANHDFTPDLANAGRKIPGDIPQLADAMRSPDFCGFLLGFDEFTSQLMIAVDATDAIGWRSLEDADVTRLRDRLQRRCGFAKISKENMRDVLEMVALERKLDSAKTWLMSLEWDGTPRVEMFLHQYMGAVDSAYTRGISMYIWTALAGRVMVPGIKADMVPVAIGPQGCGKSTSIAAMVPDPIFFGELDLAKRDDDTARVLQGKLVVEVPELRGLQGRDAASLKAFISATADRWVPKYKEHSRTAFRRCLFVGSTNEPEFLMDATGARRWLPFDVAQCSPELIAHDRDQLWAEGATLFAIHGQVLHKDAERLAAAVHSKHELHDPWEFKISEYTDPPATRQLRGFHDFDAPEPGPGSPGARLTWVTMNDLLNYAVHLTHAQQNRTHQQRVGSILRKQGWKPKQRKIDGKNVAGWIRDDTPGT